MATTRLSGNETPKPPKWPFVAAYVTFAAIAVYFLQLSRAPRATDVYIKEVLKGGEWRFPGQDVVLRRHYTGIAPLDFVASFLVAVFTHGAAGWTKGMQLQQGYFLLQFMSVVAAWAVESARRRNAWALVSFNAVWPLFYQTVGGAIVIPLFYLAYTFTATRTGYGSSSTAVPSHRARAILPAITLGFLIPTLAGWLPLGYFDIETTQALVAFWQITPFVFSLLWFLFSTIAPTKPLESQQGTFAPLYAFTFVVSVATHISALYLCTSSEDSSLTLRYVFYPSLPAAPTMAEALHFIFQIDFWIISLSTLLWVFQGQLEVISLGKTSLTPPVAVAGTVLAALALSPGAVLSAVWWWREGKIEPRAVTEKKQK